MVFQTSRWLSDIGTYRHLVAQGFKVMDDLSEAERIELLKAVFKKANLEFIDALIENGLVIKESDSDEVEITESKDSQRHLVANPLDVALEVISDDEAGVSVLECLINHGCSLNGRQNLGYKSFTMTGLLPLDYAVEVGKTRFVECLLRNGALPFWPVLLAIGQFLNVDVLRVLIDHKVDIATVGIATLHAAIEYWPDIKRGIAPEDVPARRKLMVRTLLEAGVNPNLEDPERNGYGSVLYTLLRDNRQLPVEEKKELLSLLVRHGVDLESGAGRETILFEMIANGDVELVRCLVDAGASVNATSDFGSTPLLHLVEHLPLLSVRRLAPYLIDAGVDVNAVGEGGRTFFSHIWSEGFSRGHFEIVAPLLIASETVLPGAKHMEKLSLWPLISLLIQAGCEGNMFRTQLSQHKSFLDKGNAYQLMVHSCPTLNMCLLERECHGIFHIHITRRYTKQQVALIQQLIDRHVASIGGETHPVHPLHLWCVYRIRQHLLGVTGKRSILPRLRRLHLPPALHSLLTLDCFAIEDDTEDGLQIPTLYDDER